MSKSNSCQIKERYVKIDFLKIKAASPLKHSHPGFDSYVASMEKLIRETIPESVIAIHEASYFIPVDISFQKLENALPLINLTEAKDAPCTLSLTVLVREEHAHGMGRFLCDMISQKLLPGKTAMPITFLRSLSFKFIVRPQKRYYVIELFIEIESLKDLVTIKKNFPSFEEEARLTILGVEKARQIVLSKGHTMQEKATILFENLTSLIKNPYEYSMGSIFSDVQKLILKATHDHNPNKIPDHILPYLDAKPQVFDHIIFKEMEKISVLFHDDFATKRPLNYLSKILSYLYLFRKIATYSTKARPSERHLSLKILKTTVSKSPIVALLISVNLDPLSEMLEVADIIKAISKFVPNLELVPGSNVIDEQGKEGIRLLYFEMKKNHDLPFKSKEIKLLKKRLQKEIKKAIHSKTSTTLSTNEKEVRSIISLNKELSTINDPPQAIIQFHGEKEGFFHFSAIVARVQKPHSEELILTSTPPISIRKQERKISGILDHRFLKETYIYQMTVRKEGKNIKEARSLIFAFLKKYLHNLRDFNGGMITRTYENLSRLKELLNAKTHDELIESYFYSITPSYQQGLIPPEILQKHFEISLKALDQDFLLEKTHIFKTAAENQILFSIVSTNEKEIKQLQKEPSLASDGIASISMKIFDLNLLGYIIPYSEIDAIETVDGLTTFV
ncbi:MAG: hypothetical protein KDK76_01150 [Chlamydiia bacterium]|nr:hypothetical protein [Chlamydiia bacterium]